MITLSMLPWTVMSPDNFDPFRRRGLHPVVQGGAVWVSILGYAIIMIGAYRGGHLVLDKDTMVNRSAFSGTDPEVPRREQVEESACVTS